MEALANALDVSPDGSDAVRDRPCGREVDDDYATVAYDAATGSQLWVAWYEAPTNGQDGAAELVVSPDGSEVFVTGNSQQNDPASIRHHRLRRSHGDGALGGIGSRVPPAGATG